MEIMNLQNHQFVEKFLQASGIVEATSLWAWRGLLLAVAAAATSIFIIPKLVALHRSDHDVVDAREPLAGRSGDESVSSEATSSSCNHRLEKRVLEADAAPRQEDGRDFDWNTKHRVWWRENQMEGASADNWGSILGGEVVQSWPRRPYSGRSSEATIASLLAEHQMPVVAFSPGGEVGVWDPRVSYHYQSPVISSHQHGARNAFNGTAEIFLGYHALGDVSIPDVRMLGSNYGVVSSWRGDSSWVHGSVTNTNEIEYEHNNGHGLQDARKENLVEYSECSSSSQLKSSTSMVFWLLNSVWSITSGLRN